VRDFSNRNFFKSNTIASCSDSAVRVTIFDYHKKSLDVWAGLEPELLMNLVTDMRACMQEAPTCVTEKYIIFRELHADTNVG
jgi:hypothetical protein